MKRLGNLSLIEKNGKQGTSGKIDIKFSTQLSRTIDIHGKASLSDMIKQVMSVGEFQVPQPPPTYGIATPQDTKSLRLLVILLRHRAFFGK